jgi:two-component system chemotaxis response regulator CheY
MSKTVMIVDDSPSLRTAVTIALENAGYDVLVGEDGADALTKLEGQKVHLIISDLNMPNMDGFTFIQKVKEIPSYKFTPIVMLTTEASDDKKAQGKSVGVRAWMVKPFKPEAMLDAVSKIVTP